MALLLFRDILGHPTANSWMSSCLLDRTFFLVGFVSFTGTATVIFCYAHSTTHYFLGLLITSLPVLITDVACQIQTALGTCVPPDPFRR